MRKRWWKCVCVCGGGGGGDVCGDKVEVEEGKKVSVWR